MQVKKTVFYLFTIATILLICRMLFKDNAMNVCITKAPLSIFNMKSQHPAYYYLPEGTLLHVYMGFDEGHTAYIAYFSVDDEVKMKDAASHINLGDAVYIDPIWIQKLHKGSLISALCSYPLTKEEVKSILKARKLSKAELVELVRAVYQELE